MEHPSTSSIETIEFESKDGLLITADFYPVEQPKDFVLLCHRSHFHRGEYRETARRLNQLNYTCLAIDQRSGMKVLGGQNETYIRAKAQGLATGYVDAKPDVEAAVDYLYQKAQRPIILFGSSYAAALALVVGSQTDKVKAIIAYSPVEVLKKISVAETIQHVAKPIYVTSAKSEIEQTRDIVRLVNPQVITRFEPEIEGVHGSKALWPSVKGSDIYWQSLEQFLASV